MKRNTARVVSFRGPKHRDSDRFLSWLLWVRRRLSLPLAILVSLHTGYQAAYSYIKPASPFLANTKLVIALMNVVVAVIALVFRPATWRLDQAQVEELRGADPLALSRALAVRAGEHWETRAKQADVAVLQFLRYWTGVWLAIVIYYLLMTLEQLIPAMPAWGAGVLQFCILMASIANNLMLTLCFLVMWTVTVDAKGRAEFPTAGYVAAAFILAAAYAIVFARGNSDAIAMVEQLNGVISAVVIALFVGRLESKYVNAPITAILCLYIYAAIQPLAFLVDDPIHPIAGQALLGAAFVLKAFLLLVVAWLLESGKLLFYMARVRSLQDHVRDDWEVFERNVRPPQS